jgi:superoxide dismutase, Fe-Mn family
MMHLFIVTLTVLLVAVQAFGPAGIMRLATCSMKVELPDLPYPANGLEPHISATTLETHHGKHHKKYVDTTQSMIENTDLANEDVVTILRKAHGTNQGLFNNAAQSYNHAFYWNCMKPGGGGKPSGKLMEMIEKDFGSYDAFETEFKNTAATTFGSGWTWLVHTPSGLKVQKTGNAECPLTDEGSTPLLTIDVWEHAYYLDYKNLRPSYIDTFMNSLVNWDFVASNLP